MTDIRRDAAVHALVAEQEPLARAWDIVSVVLSAADDADREMLVLIDSVTSWVAHRGLDDESRTALKDISAWARERYKA